MSQSGGETEIKMKGEGRHGRSSGSEERDC